MSRMPISLVVSCFLLEGVAHDDCVRDHVVLSQSSVRDGLLIYWTEMGRVEQGNSSHLGPFNVHLSLSM